MAACIFCKILANSAPAHRVFEDAHFLAFLDIYPVRPGHTLVIPKQHGQYLSDFEPTQLGALFALGQRLGAAIRSSGLGCQDINYLLNDGPAANQTVPHVHLHLVPRQAGDLHKVAGMLAKRPIQAFLGQASDAELRRQANEIRRAL